MAKNLIIVESPAKARTIQKMAGSSYEVKASVGHIRDLPKSKLGVDIEDNFSPKYIVIKGKEKLIKELKSAVKGSDKIFLASDPDREGEAIAWHLSAVLNIDKPLRIELHEITKEAFKEALKQPHSINMDKVNAQQARRVLDRLVGYKLSPLLWRKITKGLSAGRVQSVAVRLICEREKEIEGFVSQEYWSITALLHQLNSRDSFEAQLIQKNQEKITIANQAESQAILQALESGKFQVMQMQTREQKKSSFFPYITSTLQQDASRRLNFKASRTMRIAQDLYEGIDLGKDGSGGLITYMRTDSARISEQARAQAVDYITRTYGPNFVGEMRKPKAKNSVQDAHEAIRPTNVELTPEHLKARLAPEQYRLYKLIWERFIASQMSAALYEVQQALIQCRDYTFKAQGSKLKFEGFLRLYKLNEDNEEENPPLPDLKEGETLELEKLTPKQHFTQPPPRYTEATLIKTLEEKGIGRPSTYAPIVETIQKREYVVLEDKKFKPTSMGFMVTELLVQNFADIVDIDFTAKLENQLDDVEEGKGAWVKLVQDFYTPFADTLSQADARIEKVHIEPEVTDKVCPNCGKFMVIKKGRFGKFLACPGYPECKTTAPLVNEIGVNCPECKTGKIIEKKSRKGLFYGCSRYPECRFTSWYRPAGHDCPVCGKFMVLKRNRNNSYMACSDVNCKSRSKTATDKSQPDATEGSAPPQAKAKRTGTKTASKA